jgi:membrane protein
VLNSFPPLRFGRRVAVRLGSIGWTRAAGNLSFVTLLGLVPLVTTAFAFVLHFPFFQDNLAALETFLMRSLLPGSAATIVHQYVVSLAEQAARMKGIAIFFVIVTAALTVESIESEINALWGLTWRRPVARRAVVFVMGLTIGPALIGASISLTTWLLTQSVAAVSLESSTAAAILRPFPVVLNIAGMTLLYAVAPACPVPWRYALAGGVLAGVGFELLKHGFGWYVANVASYQALYGALAAFPAFLFWIYLCWMLFLLGAAVTATLTLGSGRAERKSR